MGGIQRNTYIIWSYEALCADMKIMACDMIKLPEILWLDRTICML